MTSLRQAPGRRIALASLCAATLLVGCASAPDPRLLSLPLPADLGQTQVADTHAVLVVRRVSIPEYLQTNRVRYRAADSILAEWPDVVWAERLESGLTDHLLMRLRARLPGWTVCERACPPAATAYVLALDLSPLDHIRSAGELRAQARWQITSRADGGKAALNGAQALVLPVATDSAESQAVTMGHMLDVIADDMAKQMASQSTSQVHQAPQAPSGTRP